MVNCVISIMFILSVQGVKIIVLKINYTLHQKPSILVKGDELILYQLSTDIYGYTFAQQQYEELVV